MTPLEVLALYPAHDGTIPAAIAARVAVAGERDCVVFEGQSWSWASFADLAARAAGYLEAQGVHHGDRVALVARNSDAHVLLLFALARLGAILVPINPALTPAESSYVLDLVEPVLVFHDGVDLPPPTSWRGVLWDAAVIADIDAAAPKLVAANVTSDDICLIIMTSGTTGFPKGVMHSQKSFLACGEGFVQRMHLQPTERMLVVLPLFHVNALFYSVAGALAAGCSLIIAARFSASGFWQLVRDTGPTEVNMIEAMGSILANRPREEFRPGHALRKAYGVRSHSEKVFREEFGVQDIVVGFGMTEAPGAIANPFDGLRKSGSMGVLGRHPDPALPWTEARIVDDNFVDVGVDEVGELVLRTPVQMRGYWRDEAQTEAAFRDGWFCSGDLVRRDADGFFFFVSRKKDIIRRRGENIAGAELDRVVGQHPAVQEAAAIPVPSDLGEDEILIVAVPRAGAGVTEREIADWCAVHLAAHKVPRYVLLASELPHTPTHKVAKTVLRADPTLKSRAVDLAATTGQGTRGV